MSKFTIKASHPFASDTREEINELNSKVDEYKARLEEQWGDLKENANDYLTKGLVIGGVTAGVYLVLDALLPEADEDLEARSLSALPKESSPKEHYSSTLVSGIKSLLWTAAIGLAKKAITDYFQAENKTDEQTEQPDTGTTD